MTVAPVGVRSLSEALSALELKDHSVRYRPDLRQDFKRTVAESYESVVKRAHAALAPLFSCHQDLLGEIATFQDRYYFEIKTISSSSWKALVATQGDKMAPLDHFRNEANTFVNNITYTLASELGLASAKFTSWGTVGYASDVDFTISMERPIIEDAVLYKTLRDLVHTYIFGDTSSKQFDTETCTPHSAEYNILACLHSNEAKRYFHTGETLSVFLQRLLSLRDFPDAYTKSKERDLNSIQDPEEKLALTKLTEQAEAIFALCRNQDAIPLRLRIGAWGAKVQQEITSEYMKLNRDGIEFDRRADSEKELDSLHLELQMCLILLALLHDEGTISSAEGRVTLLERGGQINIRVIKERANSIDSLYQGDTALRKELEQKDPRFARKVSDPLVYSARSSRELVTLYLHKDLTEKLTPRFERPTNLSYLMAAWEESSQLEHAIYQGFKEGKNATLVAIDAGKYLFRILKHLFEVAEDAGFDGLLEQLKALLRKCESLEKCKRQTTLSTPAATRILMDAIDIRPDDTIFKSRMRKLFGLFDYEARHLEKPVLPNDRLQFLESILNNMKDVSLKDEEGRIKNTLRAHAGFSRLEEPEINKLHQEARLITLQELELTTEPAIKQFFAEVLEAGEKIRTIARKCGLLPSSTAAMVAYYEVKKWKDYL